MNYRSERRVLQTSHNQTYSGRWWMPRAQVEAVAEGQARMGRQSQAEMLQG